MATVRIPCLVGKTAKNGITSWYWQPSKTLAAAGWKSLTLGKDEGAAIVQARARNAEIDHWRATGTRPEGVKRHVRSGTFASLIARYRKEVIEGVKPEDGTRRIADKTAETYKTSLTRLETWAGPQPVSYITPARVRVLRDTTAKPREQGGLGHSAALNLLKTLRQVMAFAESCDIIPKGSNPATDFGLGTPAPRSQVWELDDDAAFDAAAYDLGLPSLALAREIALYSAQREGDLIAFTEAQLQPLQIFDPVLRQLLAGEGENVKGWVLFQHKTGHAMEIPFEPQILAKVEAAIKRNRAVDRAQDPPRLLTHVLVDDRTGLPWKKRDFIKAMRKVLEHAAEATNRPGMNELVWHDLRRTRVVRLRRRGMAPAMIASITGTSPRSIEEMLKVYGPIDPTITAAAIAGALEPTAPQQPAAIASNKEA